MDSFIKSILGSFRFPTFAVPTIPVATENLPIPESAGVWPSQTSEPTPARKD